MTEPGWPYDGPGPAWLADAACADGGPPQEYFDSPVRLHTQIAMRFCNTTCPVRTACLETAIAAEAGTWPRSGVRGGHSASGRTRLAAHRRRDRHPTSQAPLPATPVTRRQRE